jgi:hypothetical protein
LEGKERIGHEVKRGVGNSEGSMKGAECNSPENPSNRIYRTKVTKNKNSQDKTPPHHPVPPTYLIDVAFITANSTWGGIFESSFKTQSLKLECLLSLKHGKFDFRALNLETTFENVTPGGIGCTS